MEVKKVTFEETKDFILNKHYAQRIPSISYAFGLFEEGQCIGICTIGKPASPNLCVGLLGKEHASKVYELNRLVVEENLPPNTLSQFVSQVLKLIRNEEMVIVSYADTGAGHTGYIYQATNWIYTGTTKSRTDKYVPGNRHSRHYSNEYEHLRKFRSSKHRYVWFTRRTRRLKNQLQYEEHPYPKGENRRYTLGEGMKTKVLNKITGEEWYE